MSNERRVTYPADVMQRVADRLGDIDWNLPGDEALEIAQEIVIDVTNAVDKLRRLEAEDAR